MKRKIILCTIAMTALLLGGCTRNTTQGTENSSVADSATHSSAANDAGQTTIAPSTDNSLSAGQSDISQNNAGQNNTSSNGTTNTGTHNGTASAGNENGTMISEEEAKQIALSHAGFTSDQVTFIKSGLDRDNGRLNYDVEFYTHDKKEYDYGIDPYSGEVLDVDYDAEYYTHSDSADGSQGTTTGNSITSDEAKKIALAKVPGATDSDIREFKSDYDNGRLEYEGKIYYEKKEYEFEIDGNTGEILEWDVEPIYGGI